MFKGFTDQTFEFFMAIRFNNNRDFFQANRDWYQCAVREPCLALAEALIPVMEDVDPDLETRPWKAVSRINRYIRFSRDKSPYRDYMWLGYRHPGRTGAPFEKSAEGRDVPKSARINVTMCDGSVKTRSGNIARIANDNNWNTNNCANWSDAYDL